MKKNRKKVITLLIFLPFTMIGTDFILAKMDIRPIFSIRTAIYKDGGTATYQGFGYKVIDYNKLEGRDDVIFIPFYENKNLIEWEIDMKIN